MTTQPGLFDQLDPARAAAELRRDLGQLRAETHAARVDPTWEERALAAVREHAATHETFLAEDVRAHCATPAGVDGRAWGAVMAAARRAGICAPAGYAPANSSNRAPKVLWRAAPAHE